MRPHSDSWLDTIAALATPAGRSALALIRVSGRDAAAILRRVAPATGDPPPDRSPRLATICDETGRVFGLMPHPEAFNHITNHPHFGQLKEEYRRKNMPLPEEGDGIRVWRNAVAYARENLV
jgi:hypothetical protein